MRFVVLLAALFLSVPCRGQMIPWPSGKGGGDTIAFDRTGGGTTGNADGSFASLTYSATVSAGLNDSVLVVTAFATVSGGFASASATYNGVAMTNALTQFAAALNTELDVWTLVNPASGTHNVVLSYSPNSLRIGSSYVSYSGVSQSSPVDATHPCATSTTNIGSFACSVTTINTGAWVVGISNTICSASQIVAGPSEGTQRDQEVAGFSSGDGEATGDKGPISPAGSVTFTFSCATTDLFGWMTDMVSLKPGP